VKGQTEGQWDLIGKLHFFEGKKGGVYIDSRPKTNGMLFADAILLVPENQ
jgi:hypothetical protein